MSLKSLISFNSMAFAGLLMMFSSTPGMAGPVPDDHAALTGLKTAKVVFDIKQGNPKKLLLRLNLVDETAKGLRAQGVEPQFVLSFRGPATFFVSNDHSRIKLEDVKIADKIAAKIKELGGRSGMALEQCAVATRLLKVDNKTINPAVTVVGNGYISLIGYQNKGYAYVPMD